MLVSILSAVKNETRYLEEMLESVVGQDYHDWELVLVDDHSTDDTYDIAQRYSQADSRIRSVRNHGRPGKVTAYNAAYEIARGDLIAFLAGDDVLPGNSLSTRVRAIEPHQHCPAVAYFRLRTISEQPKFDGMVIPRRRRGTQAGVTMIFTRALADVIFPIAPGLVAEDIWLRNAATALAESVQELPDIVLHYRIHEENSNPRHLGFAGMTESIHRRNRAWLELLQEPRFELPAEKRDNLQSLWNAEQLRYSGKVGRLLFAPGLRVIDRLAMAAMADPRLWAARTRLYRQFSGWR